MASEPLELNVYNVNDFPLLSKLVGRLARILCGKIEDRIKAKSESITHAKTGVMNRPPTNIVILNCRNIICTQNIMEVCVFY